MDEKMIIEIYENKQGVVSSIRLLERHIKEKEFRMFYGTKTRYNTIDESNAFDICRKFWVGKLDLRERVDLKMKEREGKVTYREFVNEKMSGLVF